MKKLFLLGLFVPCCLMGCASVNLGDTRGYTLFSSFVRDCGEPVSSYKLDTGETMHTFFKQCKSSSVIQKMEVIESKGRIHKVEITNECPQFFDDYILKHGVPTAQVSLQSGNIAYSFVKQCSYSPGQEETTVMVNQENIITGISRKGSCPTAYEVRQEQRYREDEMKRERRRQEEATKKKIEDLEKSLEGVKSDISFQQMMIRSAQSDIETAHLWKDADARRQKAEQEIKKRQEELKKDEKYKAQWEEEIRRLKSSLYR